MDKAIYARDLLAEEHIRIDITYEYYGKIESILAEMPRLVMSGDDTCQLALTHCIGCVNALITEEYLYDFNDLEYVNLGAEWWNRSIIKNLAVKVRFFMLYPILCSMTRTVLCTTRSLLIYIYKLENLYDLVRSGEQTFDKMIEMMSKITEDNGNGTCGKEDKWGFANPNDWLTSSFIYSSGISLCTVNEDGDFELSFGNERTYYPHGEA